MREIKFRAYEHDTKKMLLVRAIYPWTRRKYKDEHYLKHIVCRVQDGPTERVSHTSTLMEYLNKNDINNKEIYEGDIGEYTNEYEQTEQFIASFDRYSLEQIDMMNYYKGEIIGNIYENPELNIFE